jgi:hypothetical protein
MTSQMIQSDLTSHFVVMLALAAVFVLAALVTKLVRTGVMPRRSWTRAMTPGTPAAATSFSSGRSPVSTRLVACVKPTTVGGLARAESN